MLIYLFTDSLGAGGAQRQLVGLSILLKRQGYGVKVCTYYNFDFYKHFLDENFIPNEIIPGAADKKGRISAIYKYFKREKPDWVIAFQETPSLIACIAKILGCDIKLIVSERNTTQSLDFPTRLRFCLYHFADVIVPNSYTQEHFLLKHYPWMTDRIHTITNFVDLKKFYYQEHSFKAVPEIIVVASLWKSKNPRGLLNACSILKARNIKFHISWYGLNDDITEYQKGTISMCNDMQLSDMLDFLPKVKNIEEKYREANYFCLPSFYEGTPNVICEAIASGLPIICSDVCDNHIYVENGYNGILFDPKNSGDIADKIEQMLLIDNETYESYCKHSRLIAERKLSKNTFINKYIEIIENN